ncbi:DEAD/DEAH box helicase [Shewanella goraebulensis]|uniref:DEAD/DEAH box helicase n=1 Tax=Shewanella goraebulensis TaxID=3050637 RepID=UPI00254AF70B|nr:DEAD/DEAH box helicase [Shewanella goraebulensis]
MHPSIISQQVIESIKKYVKSAFTMNSPCFEQDDYSMMDTFINDKNNLLKGPYLSVQLPFRQSDVSLQFFKHFDLPFRPYAHQAIAYKRLSKAQPQSTLVATGTGSGKTECFLYPIVNACAGSELKGVKAIIIYPMNALATDQAKRFAEVIDSNTGLKGKVNVGLFVGGEQGEQASQAMSADQVITCKEHLRNNPPDILLTNYKMLDYLLMRPEDQSLWQYNQPGTLQYLVVDELHTFDGAQGSDLACLVRRLKYHLGVENSSFACVGTSATVGDELAPLLEYAGNIFDTNLDDDSVVKEDRYNHDEYLESSKVNYFAYPSSDELDDLAYGMFVNEAAYINKQISLWFSAEELANNLDAPEHAELISIEIPDDIDSDEGRRLRILLGEAIKSHRFFNTLLKMLDGRLKNLSSLTSEVGPAFAISVEDAERVIQSFVSLISIAREAVVEEPSVKREREEKGKARPVLPLLNVRHQLWLRELRRLVASVDAHPQLSFGDDIAYDSEQHFLPVINCRDCHITGWGTFFKGHHEEPETELDVFYRLFFGKNHSVRILFPLKEKLDPPTNARVRRVCSDCLTLNADSANECDHCERENLIRVFIPDLISTSDAAGPKFKNVCPCCHTKNGLSIIGAQSATLSSVAINQIYSSRYNENKKLITFSDSVQDAAHRAGFFSARTWPLMVRGHIGSVAQQCNGQTLVDFANQVVKEAQAQSGSHEAFVANFIAPNMEWLTDYRLLVEEGESGTLPAGSNLPELVAKRLNWEVFSELGLRATIGRTLERAHEVTIDACDDDFFEAASRLHAQLTEELGSEFLGITDRDIHHFMLGVLNRMRHKGAVAHDALKRLIEDGGETFKLTRIDKPTKFYMPNWGNKTRTPSFLTFGKNSKFDALLGSKARPSWHQQWVTKCFTKDSNLMINSHTVTIYHAMMMALRSVGTVERFDSRGDTVWGLEPSALSITLNTAVLGCDCCSQTMVIPAQVEDYYLDMPCSIDSCIGRMSVVKPRVEQELSLAQVHRVNAAEHTGLLERTAREQTENSFMKGKKSWSVNLLSATPTLEMGIDIGGLSSVLLCSVPPAQANYLQRIGRAGRKDGNAFNLTVAEGNPHDLYFYQEPLEMMAGNVAAPGVFLDASAILERQLTAFCMDRWIKTGVGPEVIGKNVKSMLDATEANKQDRYPYNFLTFVESHKKSLFDQFTSIFASISDSSKQKLDLFILGSEQEYSLAGKIESSLRLLVKDRKSLKTRADKLKRQIDKLNQSPVRDLNFQETMDELENERHALLALVREINKKKTLNFMTDEGLLPNYAFPEAGVTLRSVLWRKQESVQGDDGESKYVTSTFEYERPAASAIAELAPTNHFYAGGHKVEIEQIDMKVSEPETWRVCSHCNHSEQLEADQHTVCPNCEHPSWGDPDRKMQMLKLRQVYARSSARDAKISDDADTRQPAFFQRQMLVSFKKEDVNYAYQVENEDVPFGFEYLSRVSLRDINFGSASEEGEEFYVAGERKQKTGFKVCKDCGKVWKEKDFKHDIACKYRSGDTEAEFEDFLYLYRHLESEAIRILLPVSNQVAGKVTESSLSAALQLGMKLYFKGSVDHLRGAIYKEPEDAGESYRYYLVIYDSIPGGTGALKQMMQEPENLLSLLRQTLKHIESCDCVIEGKDGCYKCVYAYRDRGRMNAISRERAESLLKSIVDTGSKLKLITSLSNISIQSLSDSELEDLFIDTLSKSVRDFVFSKDYVMGKAGWSLSSKKDPKTSWHMLQHVHLGPSDGVLIDTEADFVLYPSDRSMNVKPIAIYLDGYQYHYKIVEDDVRKRAAILDSGRYHVWTLGWDDLTKEDSANFIEYFGLHRKELQQKKDLYPKFLDRNYQTLRVQYENQNNWSLLKEWLHQPEKVSAEYQQASFANCFYWLGLQDSRDAAIKSRFEYEMKENSSDERYKELCLAQPYFFGGLLDAVRTSTQLVEIASVMPVEPFMNVIAGKVQEQTNYEYMERSTRLHISFDDRFTDEDGYQSALFGFWKIVNLAQFMSDFSFTSRKALLEQVSTSIEDVSVDASSGEELASSPLMSTRPPVWGEIIELELLEESEIDLMISLGIDVPEIGYPVTSDIGELIGEAELAWPKVKVALLPSYMEDKSQIFKQLGWKFIVGEIGEQTLTQLKELME